MTYYRKSNCELFWLSNTVLTQTVCIHHAVFTKMCVLQQGDGNR